MVTITLLIWIHTISSHVRPCHFGTQFTEDVLVQSFSDSTCGCVNEHELMMLVCVVNDPDFISDKLTAIFLLVIGLTAHSILVNTMNFPKLITNLNRNAGVDTIIVVGYMALASSVRVNDDTMCR